LVAVSWFILVLLRSCPLSRYEKNSHDPEEERAKENCQAEYPAVLITVERD
jgi:hypothetical protein